MVLEDVPAGASKEWHQRDYSMKSHVEVEKLVDPDDGELDVDYLPSSITNRDDLAERCIQRDGDLFYDNHSMKWESNLALDLRPDYNPDSPLTDSDTDRGSPPVDSQRATATQCYQSCVSLRVPVLFSTVRSGLSNCILRPCSWSSLGTNSTASFLPSSIASAPLVPGFRGT